MSRPAPLPARDRHPLTLVACAALLLVMIVSRRPSVLLHAELWGDDGWSWYPDAYRIGWRSLAIPVSGYLNTLQRLVGLAVQPAPLTWVPTLFVASGMLVQMAPPLFLISDRVRLAWPHRPSRFAFAALLAVLPDEIELYANLTNAQWHFALLAFLVLAAAPPRGRAGAAFDAGVLLLCGVSGPFGILLLPIAAWQVVRAADRSTSVTRLLLLAATSAIQCLYLLTPPPGASGPIGAGVVLLTRIVALQVLLGAELGYHVMRWIVHSPAFAHPAVPATLTLAGLAVAIMAFRRGPLLLRQFSIFALLVMVAALIRSHASTDLPQWQSLATPPVGNRYFSFAAIAWIGMLLALAGRPEPIPRVIASALLLLLLTVGVSQDWREISFPRTDFQSRARRFAVAPKGTRMEFPIIPPGLSPMVLVKK